MVSFMRLRFPRSVEAWLGWVIVLMLVFFSIMSDEFLSIQNLLDLSESYAVTGIFALGLFVVLVTGGIDISFAAVASVVQYVVASLLLNETLSNPFFCLVFAVFFGIIFGLINAILIYYRNAALYFCYHCLRSRSRFNPADCETFVQGIVRQNRKPVAGC